MRVLPKVAALSAAALLVGAMPAAAFDGEPEQSFESPQVVNVLDGDTIMAEFGYGEAKVRMIGIQAPEMFYGRNGYVHENQCEAAQAEDLLTRLLPKGARVDLRAQHKDSRGMDDRLRRSIYYQGQDVARTMLAEGLALWFPDDVESAHNSEYRTLVEDARRNQVGIWKPGVCGPLDGGDVPLSMWINWDAPGNDGANPNGEFYLIRNNGTVDLDVSGWLVRESSLSWFQFPQGSVIRAGGYAQIHAGRGTNSGDTYYVGSSEPLFPNPQKGSFLGDGGYLLDTKGNMRASFMYPCAESCVDPLAGKVRFGKVMWDPPGTDTAAKEFVKIRNVSGETVNLEGYQLRRRKSNYSFALGTTLAPGSTLTVRIGKGKATGSVQYFGRKQSLLARSDILEVISPTNVRITCRAWGGDFHC